MLSRFTVLILSAVVMSSLMLTGCGRPSPNQPEHVGQVHR